MLNEYESKTKNELSREAQLGELTPTKSHFIGKEVESQMGPRKTKLCGKRSSNGAGVSHLVTYRFTRLILRYTRIRQVIGMYRT